jgi:hypothetical protein
LETFFLWLKEYRAKFPSVCFGFRRRNLTTIGGNEKVAQCYSQIQQIGLAVLKLIRECESFADQQLLETDQIVIMAICEEMKQETKALLSLLKELFGSQNQISDSVIERLKRIKEINKGAQSYFNGLSDSNMRRRTDADVTRNKSTEANNFLRRETVPEIVKSNEEELNYQDVLDIIKIVDEVETENKRKKIEAEKRKAEQAKLLEQNQNNIKMGSTDLNVPNLNSPPLLPSSPVLALSIPKPKLPNAIIPNLNKARKFDPQKITQSLREVEEPQRLTLKVRFFHSRNFF